MRYPITMFIVFLLANSGLRIPAAAQAVKPEVLPSACETSLALSAAPEYLRAKAGVYILSPVGYRMTRKGSNNFTCIVNRDDPRVLKPTCFDAEGTETIIPKIVDFGRRLLDGQSPEDISKAMSAGRAVLYFDRSVSMIGYLDGADNDNRPLHILINNLPGTLERAGASSVYAPFGTTIEEPKGNLRSELLSKDFYRDCRNGKGQSCSSNLRALFEQIESKPDEFAVVVTDLWYEEDGAEREGAVRLQDALTNILADNRTIALYGIDAPFIGPIFDVPAGGNETATIPHNGTHPLYVIAVGSKADVFEFDRQLGETVGIFQTGLEQGTIHRSIFTVDPGPLRPMRKNPVEPGNHPQLLPAAFETYPATPTSPQLYVQQFTFDMSRDGRDRAEAAEGIKLGRWWAPREDDFLPNTVHEGELVANLKVWQRADEEDPCSRWREVSDLETNASVDGQYEFQFDPDTLQTVIRRPGVYLISGQLERRSVTSPNDANAWTVPWSLSSEAASRIAARSAKLRRMRPRPAPSVFSTAAS